MGEVVSTGVVGNRIADVVAEVVHQVALAYRKYLVKGSSDMETYGVHVFKRGARGYLLGGQPALVGTPKLYLVPILKLLLATHDRTAFW